MQTIIDESRLKEVFKEALVEALEERRDIFHDMIVEAIEDISMIHAIREGEDSGVASKEEVFNILEGKA